MRNLLLTMFLLLSSHSAYAQLDDEFRQKKIDNINKADGFKNLLGERRPMKLENGIHYHGWLHNEKLDISIIQYTYTGQLNASYKKQLAQNILSKWQGKVGIQFRKWGFKDIAIMITEGVKTRVYSSKHREWFTVDEYLSLSF